MSEGFDLGLFLGSIPVILQLVADCDLFAVAAAALVVVCRLLIVMASLVLELGL